MALFKWGREKGDDEVVLCIFLEVGFKLKKIVLNSNKEYGAVKRRRGWDFEVVPVIFLDVCFK